jgi:hypothetical protein
VVVKKEKSRCENGAVANLNDSAELVCEEILVGTLSEKLTYL